MNPWINYHHLYYFKTIAEEGTISKAAHRLRVGQPTLSAQLKQFEDNLGVQLFERGHRRLTLTEHGRIALDYSKNIFRMGSEMYEVLHDRLRPQRPMLHLGTPDSVPKPIVLRLVEHALKAAPCQITLSEGKFEDLLRELSAHRIDLMVTDFLPSGASARGLSPRSLGKQNVALFGAPKFKMLRRGFPLSISRQPVIVPTYDSRLRQDLEHWARSQNVELDIVVESQDGAAKELLALNGVGLTASSLRSIGGISSTAGLVKIGDLLGVTEELFLLKANRKIENPVATELFEKFSLSL